MLDLQASQAPPRVQQTQEKLSERNMFSKFLYYSILSNQQEQEDGVSKLVSSPQLSEPKLKSQIQSTSGFGEEDDEEEEELYFSDDSEVSYFCIKPHYATIGHMIIVSYRNSRPSHRST